MNKWIERHLIHAQSVTGHRHETQSFTSSSVTCNYCYVLHPNAVAGIDIICYKCANLRIGLTVTIVLHT